MGSACGCLGACGCIVTEFVTDCGVVERMIYPVDQQDRLRLEAEREIWAQRFRPVGETPGPFVVRPTVLHRLTGMTNPWKAVRFFALLLLIELVVVAAALAIFGVKSAYAHQISPTKCDVVWQQAPYGHKWKAKQKCLAYIEIHNCTVHPKPWPRSVKVKGVRAGSNQRHVLRHIVVESQRRKLRQVVVVAAVAATTQEATARELNHGHGTSLGPFQLIDTHGSAAQRRTVEFSFNWFANGASRITNHDTSIGAAALAQAVERSGYPGAYAQWVPEARRTVKLLTSGCSLLRN